MDLKTKIKAILLEYSLRKDNSHIGSGLGGNMLYFGYLQDKTSTITNDVESVDIRDNHILWNPEFLEKTSKLDIRTKLDELVKSRIEKEGFTFPVDSDLKIDPSLVNEAVANMDVDAILSGEKELPDLSTLNLGSRLVACMRVCAKFSEQLDKIASEKQEPNAKLHQAFCNAMNNFDISVSLLSIRTQIGIDRLIRDNLDEDKILGPYIAKINHSLD